MAETSRSLRAIAVIETPEQLELNLVLAGVGSRGSAYAIDVLCQCVIMLLALFLPWKSAVRALGTRTGIDTLKQLLTSSPEDIARAFGIFLAMVTLVSFFVNFFYFASFEMLWRGQTPGKRMMGLRVVRDGGYPLDARAALLRNFLRAVDILPFNYFVGLVALFSGSVGKRVGDYVAGTVVIVENSDSASLEHLPSLDALPPGSTPTVAHPTTAQRQLIVEFLGRRAHMNPEARLRIATMLAKQVADDVPGSDPEKLLEAYVGH